MTDQHEPTTEEVQAFTAAWEAERLEQVAAREANTPGVKTRAGLTAANALRDRRVQHAVNRVVAAEIRALANYVTNVTDADEIINAMRIRADQLDEGADEQPKKHIRAIDMPKSGDGKYDQRLWHLALIENGENVAQNIDWLRTSLKIDHERAATEVAKPFTLDPRPWVFTRGGWGFTANSRIKDARDVDPKSGARFVFDPRDEYDQDFTHYPEDVYGPVREHTKPFQTTQEALASARQSTSLRGEWAAVADMITEVHHKGDPKKPGPVEDITDEEIYKERQHQISSGYTARHDDEHGLRHLLLWAVQYGKRGKTVQSLALIRAALESMARKGQDL